MRNLNRYILPDHSVINDIIKKISEKYRVTEGRSANSNLGYYDTFDWRLYSNNLVVTKDKSLYSLRSIDEKSTFATAKWTRKRNLKFWWEFPNGALKNKIKPITDVRALLPIVEINRSIKTYKINSTVRRQIAVLSVEDFKLQNNKSEDIILRLLVINPSRNALSEYLELQGILRSFSLLAAEDIYHQCLKAKEKTPEDYKSKIEIPIDSNSPSAEAARNILSFLFEIMKKNEEGIKKNIDAEFLHDYRVAVRRTRTILGQLKGVFSPVVSGGLKTEFARLGKLSNVARDYDVYMLRRSEYESMLPENLSDSLNPLFDYVEKRGKREHRKLVKWLNSKSYSDFKESYTAFLTEIDSSIVNDENSNVPIGKLATEAILNKYSQVIDYGTKITKSTPDEDLHRLRIECKKLRYLLELFSNIYTPKKVEFLITQLKRLQTNLGDFNDMFVQQESLQDYLNKIQSNQINSIKTASAIGGLITHLHSERLRVRKAFKKTFDTFYKSSAKKIKKSLNHF